MKIKIILMALVLVISSTTALYAHKVIVFAWVEQGQIHVEGSFGSKRAARNCVITVKNSQGIMVHQGTTDTLGHYSFAIPEKPDSDLIIQLDGGPGHSGSWTIEKKELVAQPSSLYLEKKMAEKYNLEKGPSLSRIAAGIALIFGLAFTAAFINKQAKKRKSDV